MAEIVRYLHPSLLQLNYQLTCTKLGLVAGSFFFFFGTYVTSAIVASFTSTYKSLRIKEKVFWNLAVVRAVFGVFGAIIGLWAIFNKSAMDNDVVFGTTQTSYFALCVTEGFFIFECSALAVSDVIFNSFSLLLNLHHWLSLTGYFVVLCVDAGHCFATKGLLLEMSTPFSALCWTLLKSGRERTFLWKANQFLLVHTFHCRNIVEWLLVYISYQNWTHIWSSMPLSVFLCLYIQLPLVTLVMTPYWTYKKTEQMFNPVDWNFSRNNKASEPTTRSEINKDPETNGTLTEQMFNPVDWNFSRNNKASEPTTRSEINKDPETYGTAKKID
ncbi:protein CLN8-like isoform X3 [Haliotis rufescens]|uniref:protein CLN8-like isoform X3 n=1 Tax=Haliotis rufescens TaxID=6454 RepID=UPI00201E7705|nr:protein CLN8-like isoform X3 [Haliotis rufescens]